MPARLPRAAPYTPVMTLESVDRELPSVFEVLPSSLPGLVQESRDSGAAMAS